MRTRTGHGPLDWSENEPSSPHRFSRAYSSIPAVTISEMRPVLTYGSYFENRHRSKPPNPLSIHPENRR